MSRRSDSFKPILLALGANFSIFLAKLVAAIFTGSGSMLAEAVHSLSDCGNQGLLLLGLRQARRPATSDHPLGWGKALYFWSFLVAILLFSVGGIVSVYEGLHKLTSPELLRYPWAAVGVLLFGLLAEGISLRGCMQQVNAVRGRKNLWRWFRDSRSSELLVIFGEDLAALAGLTLALAAIAATVLTGNPLYDAMGSIAIGVLLVVVAVGIAIEVKALLIGQSMEPDREQELREFLGGHAAVRRLLNLITLQLGPDVMVAVKAHMQPASSGHELVEAINGVEREMKQAFPEIRWSFFEPDVRD